jgi:hypothetical protein
MAGRYPFFHSGCKEAIMESTPSGSGVAAAYSALTQH